MNTNLLFVLKKIIDENGEDGLSEITVTNAALANSAEPKREKTALLLALTADYHKDLREANESERAAVKQSLAKQLCEEEGLDGRLCNATLDLLCAALFGEKAVPEMPTVEDLELKLKKKLDETDTELKNAINKNKTLTENLKKAQKNAENAVNEKRQIKASLVCAIVLGIIAVTVSIIVGVSQYNNLIDEYNNLSGRYDSLQSENSKLSNDYRTLSNNYERLSGDYKALADSYSKNDKLSADYKKLSNDYRTLSADYKKLSNDYRTLSANYEKSKNMWIMKVTDMKVGNSNNGWITQPGKQQLKASDIRYLSPVFTYNSLVETYITYYIKIIEPTGIISRGDNSPTGFTYKREFQVKKGKDLKFEASGWGTSSGGSYYSGRYTIELWCEGFCLYSGSVRLD
jgi:predicted nuclease with TOPRIM domain